MRITDFGATARANEVSDRGLLDQSCLILPSVLVTSIPWQHAGRSSAETRLSEAGAATYRIVRGPWQVPKRPMVEVFLSDGPATGVPHADERNNEE